MLNIASRHFLCSTKKKKEEKKVKGAFALGVRGRPQRSVSSWADPGTRCPKDCSHFSPINAVGRLEIFPGKPVLLLWVGFGFVEAPAPCLQAAPALHLTTHRTPSPSLSPLLNGHRLASFELAYLGMLGELNLT